MNTRTNSHQALSQTLKQIDGALGENIERSIEIRRRLVAMQDGLESGVSVRDLIESETPPRSVEMITANHAILEGAGAEFRVRLAQALRREGMTIEAIGALFGVTRQRVSALLKQW